MNSTYFDKFKATIQKSYPCPQKHLACSKLNTVNTKYKMLFLVPLKPSAFLRQYFPRFFKFKCNIPFFIFLIIHIIVASVHIAWTTYKHFLFLSQIISSSTTFHTKHIFFLHRIVVETVFLSLSLYLLRSMWYNGTLLLLYWQIGLAYCRFKNVFVFFLSLFLFFIWKFRCIIFCLFVCLLFAADFVVVCLLHAK